MSDVVDILHEFRQSVPEPRLSPGSTAEIAIERGRCRRSRARGRVGKVAALTAGGVATAGLAGVLGYLFVASPAPTPTSGSGRVDWGMVEQLRVKPAPGVTLDVALRRSIEALKFRAEANDIAGMTVKKTAPDVITIAVPGIDGKNDLLAVSSFQTVDIFNLSTSLIARGRGLAAIAGAAARLPGRPVRWAVAGTALPDSFGTMVGSYGAAKKQLRLRGLKHGVIVPLPAGVLLVDEPSPRFPEYLLIRDAPIATAEQLQRVSFENRRMDVVVRAEYAGRFRRVLERALSDAPPEIAVITRTQLPQEYQGGRGYEFASSSRVDLTASGFALGGLPSYADDQAAFASGGEPVVPAKLALKFFGPYGTVPLPAGERVALPEAFTRDDLRQFSSSTGQATPIENGSIVRALTVHGTTPTWELFAGRTTAGREAAWLYAASRAEGPISLDCSPGPGVPILRLCSGIGVNKQYFAIGRARAEVASVERRDTKTGHIDVGAVGNSWFVVPYVERKGSRAWQREIVARDASGKVIARLDEAGRLIR